MRTHFLPRILRIKVGGIPFRSWASQGSKPQIFNHLILKIYSICILIRIHSICILMRIHSIRILMRIHSIHILMRIHCLSATGIGTTAPRSPRKYLKVSSRSSEAWISSPRTCKTWIGVQSTVNWAAQVFAPMWPLMKYLRVTGLTRTQGHNTGSFRTMVGCKEVLQYLSHSLDVSYILVQETTPFPTFTADLSFPSSVTHCQTLYAAGPFGLNLTSCDRNVHLGLMTLVSMVNSFILKLSLQHTVNYRIPPQILWAVALCLDTLLHWCSGLMPLG